MKKKNFIMSFSGGKDSTLALHRMIKAGHNPMALIITIDKDRENSWFHSISKNHIKEVAKSLDIPLMLIECEGSNYENSFVEALEVFKNNGADCCVFGDIDIDAHRKWCQDRCDSAKLDAVFPLWQEGREDLVHEFIDTGFKAVIKVVNLNHLSQEFLGKTLDRDIVKDIKATGSDPCGENGEYHTFVYDGPLFNVPIQFEVIETAQHNDYGFLNIK
ncbi:diphthine--ammonia ligase [Cetobacterium sp. 2A]|uniref:Dph6-related ATP pyrophosphatase n=1 Tax=unclassified Cetobacterium TaxID=2630983 RepID=UPI00163CEDE2|nr:diphthine--ammonia ligase [Cetobacterium sp. 2A]MBC2855507.1 diphthine--ammonia ligase [Cetobacterium sp. 2A]